MNDKCAAGTGRFLQVMANALEIDINDLSGLATGQNLLILVLCVPYLLSQK